MILGSLADAFGFTPDEVYRLTPAQLAAYGRYMEEKADATEHPRRPAPGHEKKVDSLGELIAMFGSPESKAALAAP